MQRTTHAGPEKADELKRRRNREKHQANHAVTESKTAMADSVTSSPASSHEAALREASSDEQRAVLARQLQQTYGNAYVNQLLQAGGAKHSEDDITPDTDAPIEQDADVRSERSDPPTATQGTTGTAQGNTVAFPSYSAIVTDATVKSKADQAWKDTLAATTPTARREQGFWVRWNSKASKYSVTGEVIAPTVDNATTASVNLPAKPADSADEYTVASFHTHTPTTHRSVGRPVGPSGADGRADTADNVAGVVYDYTAKKSGNIPAKHPLASPAEIYHSGPDKRT